MGQDDEMVDFNAGEERVFEWEDGLPRLEDLTPLSQMLIPPELASAFSITSETCRNMEDVDRPSRDTISKLRMRAGIGSMTNNSKALPPLANRALGPEGGGNDDRLCSHTDDNEGRRGRESEFSLLPENSTDDSSARMLKRPRLVWTPQLHKRFVDVVGHLGIKNAVPKTIMQMMNVEGLTRENVASHLQKYRLYLKRMQGFPGEGRSSLDQLFASTPVPQSLTGAPFVSGIHCKDSTGHMPIPMPYVAPFVPMPVVGTAQSHHGALAIHGPAASNMFEAQSTNGFDRNLIPQRMSSGDHHHRDWPCNKF